MDMRWLRPRGDAEQGQFSKPGRPKTEAPRYMLPKAPDTQREAPDTRHEASNKKLKVPSTKIKALVN